MDKTEMSLDDLIKINKKSKTTKKTKGSGQGTMLKGSPKKKKPGVSANIKRLSPKKKGPVLDARTKIIQKNRTKIRDARERIAENIKKNLKDARSLLSRENSRKVQKKITIPRSRPNQGLKTDDDLLMDEDDYEMEGLDNFKLKPVGSIKLTVQNEMYRSAPPKTMPKLPHFSIGQSHDRLSPTLDPFDCYVVPSRPLLPLPSRPERVERYQPGRAMSAHMDAYSEPRKSILRSTRDEHDDRFDSDRYDASQRYVPSTSEGVRSRLYNESRDRTESAGIFAKLPSNRAPSPPPNGYRIIVSNLNATVTDSDVRELFEDVGTLVQSHLVRPGIAEVVYKNLNDAEDAVETYHNRQLDGRPMKVMLVKPRNSKPTYGRMADPDDLDIDVVHKALFRR